MPVVIPYVFANSPQIVPATQLDANFNVLTNAVNAITSEVNVLAFGAVPDGVTDCTAAFNAAIAWSIATGPDIVGTKAVRQIIRIPGGTYALTPLNPIVNGPSLWFVGDGPGATKIITSGADSAVFSMDVFSTTPANAFVGTSQDCGFLNMSIINMPQDDIYSAEGTVTTATTTVITDATKNFVIDSLAGLSIGIYASASSNGVIATIASNTATTITLTSALSFTPSAGYLYVVEAKTRGQIAIQDNGCGGMTINNVIIRGFKYGICWSYGSDFSNISQCKISCCDTGLYVGPGSQQIVCEKVQIEQCKQGLVVDGILQGAFNEIYYVLNRQDISLQGTYTNATQLGVTTSYSALPKLYTGDVRFDTSWHETGAGGVLMPYDVTSHVLTTGPFTWKNFKWKNTILVSGTVGMPAKVGGQSYLFLASDFATNVQLIDNTVYGTRIDAYADSFDTARFPLISVDSVTTIDGAFSKSFLRPSVPNFITAAQNDLFPQQSLAVAAQEPYQFGGPVTLINATGNYTTHDFRYQFYNGTFLVTIRMDFAGRTSGLIRTGLIVIDNTSPALASWVQLGTDITYGSHPPTSVTVSVVSTNVLNVNVVYPSSTLMSCSVSRLTLQAGTQ